MGLRRIPNNHFVSAFTVIEEVEYALFFHQPARKIEVRLPVLHAVFARLVVALKFPVTIDTGQNRFENVRNRLLLKYPALRLLGQKPSLRNNFGSEICEPNIPVALRKRGTDSVDISPFRVASTPRRRNFQRDFLPDEFAEIDLCRILGDQVYLKQEKSAESLGPTKPGHQQGVCAKRRCDLERPVRLCECRHQFPLVPSYTG